VRGDVTSDTGEDTAKKKAEKDRAEAELKEKERMQREEGERAKKEGQKKEQEKEAKTKTEVESEKGEKEGVNPLVTTETGKCANRPWLAQMNECYDGLKIGGPKNAER
jgi:hypothetical protein